MTPVILVCINIYIIDFNVVNITGAYVKIWWL